MNQQAVCKLSENQAVWVSLGQENTTLRLVGQHVCKHPGTSATVWTGLLYDPPEAAEVA